MLKLLKLAFTKRDAKKAYKKYVSTESSPLLRKFAAESHRERVRGLKKDFKTNSKSN